MARRKNNKRQKVMSTEEPPVASQPEPADDEPKCDDIQALAREEVPLPPSCIEFLPHLPQYFVVGSYHLDETLDREEETLRLLNVKKKTVRWAEPLATESRPSGGKGKGKGGWRKDRFDCIGGVYLGTEIPSKFSPKLDRNEESPQSAPGDVLGSIVPEDPGRATDRQTRVGMLSLYRLDDQCLTLVDAIAYPMGILDLHFSPHYPGLFAVASSAGCITLYHTTDIEDGDPHSCRIQHVFTYQLFPVSTLVLSLAWHQYKGVMAVTLSTGKVAVVEFLDDFKVGRVITEELNPHSDLEAWTVAWSNISSTEKGLNWQAIYSGGDDGQLRCTKFPNFNSLRDDSDYLVDSSPGGRRGISGHQAGVTAILPLPLRTAAGEDILLTGSYDDYVRVVAAFDHRSKMLNKRPKVLAEVNLGGGVWRLKFLRNYSRKLETCIATSSIESGDTSPADQKSSHETAHDQDRADVTYRVLACCMHAGSRILEVTGNKYGDWTITVLARFTEHESMNYGSDVQPILHPGMSVAEELDDSNALVVSTSFYDKLLCVWRFGKGHQSDDAIASETSVGTEHGEDFTTPLSVAVNSKEEAVTPTIAPVSTELLEDISTPTTAPVTAKLAEDAATPSSAPVTTRRGRSGSRKRKGSTTCMTGTFTSPSSTTVSTDHAEHVSAPSAKPGSTKCGGSGTRKAKDNTTDSVRDNMENVTTFSSKTADTNSIEYVSTPSAPPANTRRGRSGSRKANGNTTGNVKGNTENVTPLSSTTTGTNHTEHVPIPSTLANTKRGRSGSRKPKEGTTVGDKENIDDVIPTPNAGTEGEAPTRRLSVRLRERK